MQFLVVHITLLLCTLSFSAAQDKVWYISADPNASSDIASCGRSLEAPCNSLQVIIDQSSLFDNGTTVCRLSNGDDDGRTSTTLYFLEGRHFVPPVCLKGWDNLSIIGMGDNVTISSRLGAPRGFFEFNECTGVSISNIHYDIGFIGKSTLFFDGCRDISITGCSFSVHIANTRGIEMSQCSGQITLSQCLFVGEPSLAGRIDNYIIALSISHGCEVDRCTPADPFQLSVVNSTFINVTSGGEPVDDYGSVRSRGAALRVRFLRGSVDSSAMFDRLQVQGTVNPSASSVLVNFDLGSSNNKALFVNSHFRDNRVRYGGGIAGYFYAGPTNSLLEINDCTFESNEAAYEGGGVLVTFLVSDTSNTLLMSRNMFKKNSALVGAGIFVLNSPFFTMPRGLFHPNAPPLVSANLTDCTFIENKALNTEGVVSLLRIELYVNGMR